MMMIHWSLAVIDSEWPDFISAVCG